MLAFALAPFRMAPERSFAETPAPEAPDYADPRSWAALPGRVDPSDWTPPGEAEIPESERAADVFYLHPTTYHGSGWNQPVGDANANRITDEFALRNQAAAFGRCCRIYAPRYRQAVLYAFFSPFGGSDALALAYSDVERAFDHYLAQYSEGRPFVLVGHSQGAVHLETLLERRISGGALQRRLVAAYAIGHRVSRGDWAERFPDLPLCESERATRCYLSWNTVGPRARRFGYSADTACVNPLSGRADGRPAPHAMHRGAVSFEHMDATDAASLRGPWNPRIEPGACRARCESGALVVREIRSPHFAPLGMARDSHHIHDFNLFFMNIRAGAAERVAAFGL